MQDRELMELMEKLGMFKKTYDTVRVVDPTAKKVLRLKDNEISQSRTRCFDFWGKRKICDNCISIRAFHENKTYFKIEYALDQVYMVTAVPVEINENRVVVEMFKNVTDSMVFDHDQQKDSSIYSLIECMNQAVSKDALTGLFNRRYIQEKLPVEIVNAALSSRSLSVIMADIDFFKKINDTFGHLTGDSVLKQFAVMLSDCIKRASDWVARFGGEEFLVCLPGADETKARSIAEEMRKKVERTSLNSGDHTLNITASFGVASLIPAPGSSPDSIIEQADNKLYEAKKNGRNRVEG